MQGKPLAYDAYQELAEHYASLIDTKPHNAFYDRPAMLAMWPDLRGKRVLDAGCGPGAYSEMLAARGARVTGIDVSERMLAFASQRLGNRVDLRLVDISQPMPIFQDDEFDFINAPLCLDYVENWRSVFQEFHRILKPNCLLQFSCGHPAFDADFYRSNQYFSIEQVACEWTGFGKSVVMPSYRRSLQEVLMPAIETGFDITKVIEPLPTDDFRRADPIRYQQLQHRPAFLCVQVRSV